MKRIWPPALLLILATFTGCGVERRLFITSDPAGALVHLNDIEVGVTPVEVDFTWYGEYDVRLEKDGYEPIMTTAVAKAPLYEAPVIDLAAAVVPGKKSHVRWHFDLEPADDDADSVVERAIEFRETMFEPVVQEPGETPHR